MACEDCNRRELAGNIDGLDQDVAQLERVNRNQGVLLLVLAVSFLFLVARLNAKGVLSYRELLDGIDG